MEEIKKTARRRSKKGAERTARSICRALLARTLPAGAADFGVLQTVAEELEPAVALPCRLWSWGGNRAASPTFIS